MKSLNPEQNAGRPNFKIDSSFPWVVDAQQKITAMYEENIKDPLAIMDDYKKFEYLMNVDKKELSDKLFNNKELEETTGSGKASIDVLREQI
jgi:hypothetical protein